MARASIAKTFTQMLREEDAYARRKVLREVLSFDNCVTEIPEGVNLDTKYRVVGLTMVRWVGQQVKLAHGSVFALRRYGPDAVREWIKGQDLHLELVDPPVVEPMPKAFYEYAKSETQIVKPNNDAESCDKAPDKPVEAPKETDVSEPPEARRKPGRPPSARLVSNPFAPGAKKRY